jgi:hypothetical protein
MRAMTTLILETNSLLNKESGTVLGNMLRSNTVLTKLDVSDNAYDSDEDDGPGFAQELAVGIRDNGTLSVLSLKSNGFWADGGKALAKGLKGNTVVTELDISSNHLGVNSDYEPDVSGVIALADAIPYMEAMTVLNLASNGLGAEGAKFVAEAIKVTMCAPAIILASFSCPSDFSVNCCCLLLSAGYEGHNAFGYQ